MSYNRESNFKDAPNFWKHVKKTDTCWLWTGPKDPEGYGLCYHNGVQKKAHRVSYDLHWSAIPKSYIVRHRCDVAGCVNPDHLLLGFSKQNSQDMVDRHRSNKGKMVPRVSIDLKSKVAVEYDANVITRAELASKYGLNLRTVSRIIKDARSGKVWGCVKSNKVEKSKENVKLEIKDLLHRLLKLVDSL